MWMMGGCGSESAVHNTVAGEGGLLVYGPTTRERWLDVPPMLPELMFAMLGRAALLE